MEFSFRCLCLVPSGPLVSRDYGSSEAGHLMSLFAFGLGWLLRALLPYSSFHCPNLFCCPKAASTESIP